MTYGTYNYLSMTNVDIISCKDEIQIYTTAVHEFIHAYLTKGSLYGVYLINMRQLNHIDQKYSSELKKSTKNWGNRNYKNKIIFEYLQKNMKNLQEYVATIIELLYSKYKYGNNQFQKKMQEIYRPAWDKNIYTTCIKKYGYILKDEYLKSYLNYLQSMPASLDDKYKMILQHKTTSEAALDVMMASILHIALHSLQIDLRFIENEKWKSKQELKRYIETNQMMYFPSVRFNRCIKKLLPENNKFSLEYPEEFFVDYVDDLSLQVIDSFSLNQRHDNQNETANIVHNNVILKEMYEVERYPLLYISQLEEKSLTTAMPAVLNQESKKKLFDIAHIDVCKVIINGNKESVSTQIWNHFDVLHIHPTTGILYDEYKYLLIGNTMFNTKCLEEVVTKNYNNIYYEDTFESLEKVCKIISTYTGEIYISGCDRSEKLIKWISTNKPNTNIYLFTATSIEYSKWYVNKYLKSGDFFVWKSYFKSYFLIIKKNHIFFVQELICNSDSIIKSMFGSETMIMDQESFRKIYLREYKIINQIIKNNYFNMSNCETYIEN